MHFKETFAQKQENSFRGLLRFYVFIRQQISILTSLRRLSIQLKTLKGNNSRYCHNSCPSCNTAPAWRLKTHSVKNAMYV